MTESTRAIRIHAYGGIEQLVLDHEVHVPDPGPEEILVRAHAVAVNPVDTWVRSGQLADFLNHDLPLVMGWDVSGTVVAAGAAVTDFKAGDDIFARPWTAQSGTFADLIVLPAAQAAIKPANVPHEIAAAVPLAAQTAWGAFTEIRPLEAGERVLIRAAAGGVGVFAVQLARRLGAQVIGTASAANHAFVVDLGADEVHDYHDAGYESRIRDIDVILDGVGEPGLEALVPCLKPGGCIMTLVPGATDAIVEKHRIKGEFILPMPDGTRLDTIGRLVDSGEIVVPVSRTLELAEARLAHELIESGHTRGKMTLVT